MSSSTKLTGVHGVGLAGVAIKSDGKTVVLSSSGSNNFKASVGLLVVVTVSNQGATAEANVPVKVIYTGPEAAPPRPSTPRSPRSPCTPARPSTCRG